MFLFVLFFFLLFYKWLKSLAILTHIITGKNLTEHWMPYTYLFACEKLRKRERKKERKKERKDERKKERKKNWSVCR